MAAPTDDSAHIGSRFGLNTNRIDLPQSCEPTSACRVVSQAGKMVLRSQPREPHPRSTAASQHPEVQNEYQSLLPRISPAHPHFLIKFHELFLNIHILVSAMVAAPAPPPYIPSEPLETSRFQRKPDRSNGATMGQSFV